MTSLDRLGLVATCFTTSAFVPQVWRTWKTRDVSGISLPTYVIITIGLALWLLYGWLRGDMPLMVRGHRRHPRRPTAVRHLPGRYWPTGPSLRGVAPCAPARTNRTW
ncbi:MAG: SemiSWEET family transporter [Pseudomonadota bacterium]|nr:SemiSWEET family transporter [Pseudomonadota bacterium]